MDSYYTLRRGVFGKPSSSTNTDSDIYFNNEIIKIANRNYMQIEGYCFDRFPALKTLVITRCKIKYIKEDVFGKFKPKLDTLDLSHNLIHTFSYITILNSRNLKTLVHVNLSHNTLTRLDMINFEGFDSLKTINLSHNRIETLVSSVFKNLTNLEHIDLSHNRISKVWRDTLVNLPSLKTVDLSFNRWQDVNVFSFSSYTRNQDEFKRKVEKLFKLVHFSYDKIDFVDEDGDSGGAIFRLVELVNKTSQSMSKPLVSKIKQQDKVIMIRKRPPDPESIFPFNETDLNLKLPNLNSSITLYLDDSFENDALSVQLELRNDTFRFTREDMEQVADEFLKNKYPCYFLKKIGAEDKQSDDNPSQNSCWTLMVTERWSTAKTLFDILLQEAAHSNELFMHILLDIVERKYKPFSDGLPFSRITLADESLEQIVETVNAGLNKKVLKRILKCLTLDKEQCLTLFRMAYKQNCEKLTAFVFDSCLRYQKTDKLKDIVRLYFKEMCDKNWLVVLMSLLDSCRLNEINGQEDDDSSQRGDKPPEWTAVYDFTFLDVNITEENAKKFNHPLLHIADSNQACLLKHPTTQKLLHLKWRFYPRILYYLEIGFYLLALIAYSLLFFFIIEHGRKESERSIFMSIILNIPSLNVALFGISLFVKVVCRVLYVCIYQFVNDKSKFPKFAFLQLNSWTRGTYLMHLISETMSLVLSLYEFTNAIAIQKSKNACVVHHYGVYSFSIVLNYFLFVQRLDKVAYIGHYVQVYTQVAIKSFQLLPFLVILTTGFLIAIQAQLSSLAFTDPNTYSLSINYIWFNLFQGQLDINEIGIKDEVTSANWIYYFMIFVFIFFMTIMFFNMFIGIATGEVSTLARHAEILYIKSVVSLCFDLGELHKPIGMYDPVKYHWLFFQRCKMFAEKWVQPVVKMNLPPYDGLGEQNDSTSPQQREDVMFRLQSLENDMRTIVKEMGKLRESVGNFDKF